jgi:hypothetical protein
MARYMQSALAYARYLVCVMDGVISICELYCLEQSYIYCDCKLFLLLKNYDEK